MLTIIPTAGQRLDLFERTLSSLAACDLPESFHGVIVIENGPKGAIESAVATAPDLLNVRYMYRERGNKSAALNSVLETVGDGLLVFLDDDVRLSPNVLRDYVEAGTEHGTGHFFGGPVSCDYESEPPAGLMRYLPPSARGWRLAEGETFRPDGYFLGANWAAFAEDLRAAGGFDPDRGPGSPTGATGQETDMQRRLRERGSKPVYLPQAEVWHYVPKRRCTWRWAAERAYRGDVEQSLQNRDGGRLILGCPGYAWPYLFRATANALAGVATCSRDRLFRVWFYIQRWRGSRHGIRVLHNQRNHRDTRKV